MKTLFFLSLVLSLNTFAQTDTTKTKDKKDKMDYGDKQLLKRDTCRKPMEALQTKYPEMTKEDLEKMKAKCEY